MPPNRISPNVDEGNPDIVVDCFFHAAAVRRRQSLNFRSKMEVLGSHFLGGDIHSGTTINE